MSLAVVLLLATALGSGLAGALVDQFIGGLFTARRQRNAQEHEQQLQDAERNHQWRLRTEQSHFEARDRFVESASHVLEWLRHGWGKEYGLEEGDWVPDHEPIPNIENVGEVLRVLRKIGSVHPTDRVRSLADQLASKISGHFGSIDLGNTFQTGVTPTSDQFREWVGLASKLIESMHDLPHTLPQANTLD